MIDHSDDDLDEAWGRCTRCGGWIWQGPLGFASVARGRWPGYPHEVVAGPVGGAGACQCPPAAPSPEPAGEAEDPDEVTIEEIHFSRTRGMELTARHPAVAALSHGAAQFFLDSGATNYVVWQLWEERLGRIEIVVQRVSGETPAKQASRLRAERDRLRDAGDRMRMAGESCIADAAEEWPDEDEIPRWCYRSRDAWDRAADAWMAAREMKP